MPNGRFYLRNHFDIPKLNADSYRLSISGMVEKSQSLSMRDLRTLRSESFVVTLECAGNGRARLDPRPVSQPWLQEAVGTGSWRGVPLRAVQAWLDLSSKGQVVSGCMGAKPAA